VRAVLGKVYEKKIAPYAADVDEYARFAQQALDISGFSAVHITEEYGGQGADSVATRVVIDEVAARGPDLPGADSEKIYVVPRARRRLLATFDDRLSGLAEITTDTK